LGTNFKFERVELNNQKKISVLFVCMGNICRSPTAEGVFRKQVEDAGYLQQIEIDSAGTHAYHAFEPPDPRAQSAALLRGFDLSPLKARKVQAIDFEVFDYILAMDKYNYDSLVASCPKVFAYKISMFLKFAPDLGIRDVPDPYYGGEKGFEEVLDLVEEASFGFLQELRKREL